MMYGHLSAEDLKLCGLDKNLLHDWVLPGNRQLFLRWYANGYHLIDSSAQVPTDTGLIVDTMNDLDLLLYGLK